MAGLDSELVKKLTGGDPNNLPRVVVLTGFPGPGPKWKDNGVEKQKWRVYLDHALTSYYELDDTADIVHDAELETGGEKRHRVWVREGAPIRLVRTRAERAEIPPLLGGPIAQTWLPAAPQAAPRWAQTPPGGHSAQGPGQDGWEWDPSFEWSKCRVGCASASP